MEKEAEVKTFGGGIPITNRQMESMLKVIPAGWTVSFKRELLRPDKLEMILTRADGMGITLKTTGAMLLAEPDVDFLPMVTMGCQKLMAAKRG